MKRHINISTYRKRLGRAAAALLLAATAAMTACSETYPGLAYDYGGSGQQNTEGAGDAVPIRVYATKRYFFSVTAGSAEQQSSGAKTSAGLTRGTGPIDKSEDNITVDEKNFLQQKTFHIFAFRYGKDEQGPQAQDADLRKTLDISASAGWYDPENNSCLVDNSKDYDEGMTAVLDLGSPGPAESSYRFVMSDDPHPDRTTGDPYSPVEEADLNYSSTYEETGYCFFGYHTDGAHVSTSREADAISHGVEIDGSNDLMYGYAEPVTALTLKETYDFDPAADAASAEAYKKIVASGTGYSTYSARRGIYPIVGLRHQLARLFFEVKPAAETAKDVVIDSILVWSKYKGTMTVAARVNSLDELPKAQSITWQDDDADRRAYRSVSAETSAQGTYKWLDLREESADGYEQCQPLESFEMISLMNPVTETDEDGNTVYKKDADGEYMVNWDPNTPLADRKGQQLGSSLMIPETDSIAIMICFHQGNLALNVGGGSVEYRPSHQYTALYWVGAPEEQAGGNDARDPVTGTWLFSPGYYYNIKVGVYGLQKIEVYAGADGWQSGGDIIINPDDI